MTYLDLTDSAKNNAIINYCNIMGIDITIYKDEVIEWFIKFKVNTLNENGQFIHAGEKNIA